MNFDAIVRSLETNRKNTHTLEVESCIAESRSTIAADSYR